MLMLAALNFSLRTGGAATVDKRKREETRS